MNKGMTILYEVYDNLYVNLTNRCPCACTFCLRQNMDTVSATDDRPLWLEREPELSEVIAEFQKYDMDKYNEVVFCGYGEPTERLDVLLEVARYIKANYKNKIRVNTNGMADLIWGKDTTSQFEGLVDIVSISLNNPDPVKYQEIVRCKFGEKSFDAMLQFAQNVKKYVPNVVMSTVSTTISEAEEERCADICKEIGVTYRIRPFEGK